MAKVADVVKDDGQISGRRSMVNLTKEQHEWARKTAFEKNISIAAVIRDAIDAARDQAKTA